jgi:adenine-specific DNA-methyltransferase
VTETFCENARFFQPRNGARIDAIREEIKRKSLEPELEAVLLTSLMEAADRVDSTTGVQMAYLKQWAPRAHNDLQLRVPEVLPRSAYGKGSAQELDAAAAAAMLSADIAYLDPPYNQHKYVGNYHIWETLVRWDRPEAYGVAQKRVDCKERRSPFNSRVRIHEGMAAVLEPIGRNAQVVIVSFSNEGFLSRAELETMLASLGQVTVLEHDYKRYVGAQIGVYSPKGERVGKVSHLRNTERLYVVGSEAVARAVATLQSTAHAQVAAT